MTIFNKKDVDGNHPLPSFFNTTREEVNNIDMFGLFLNNNMSWDQVVCSMAKSVSQQLVTWFINAIIVWMNQNKMKLNDEKFECMNVTIIIGNSVIQ